MVAYSFNKRFVPAIQAGLEPGPWVPGMKRHTMRTAREGRARHAGVGATIQLYTGMRTKHCRKMGVVRCLGSLDMWVGFVAHEFRVMRAAEPSMPNYAIRHLAEPLRELLRHTPGAVLGRTWLDSFARTDGFRDGNDMAAFFATTVPEHLRAQDCQIGLVLIAWEPPV